MMKLIVAAALLFLTVSYCATPSYALAPGGMVRFGLICDLQGIMEVSTRLQADIDNTRFQDLNCAMSMPAVLYAKVTAIIAGPFKDSDGDTLYVVEVDSVKENPAYTIVWEGLNYIEPIGFEVERPDV